MTAFALTILVIAGVALMFREQSAQQAHPGPVTQPTVDRVEVEHLLVTAEEVEPLVQGPAASPIRPPRKTSALRRPAEATLVRSAANGQKASLSEKTRRALLGDGRHRPQPFPRINN